MSFFKSKILASLAVFVFFSVIHFAMGYGFKLFYILAITFLMLCLNPYRRLYTTIIIFYAIVAALYFPVGMLYGPPGYNIVSAFYYTNTEEATGFISNIKSKYYLVSAIILILGIAVSRLRINTSKKTKKILLSMFIIITIIQPVKAIYNNSFRLLFTTGQPEIRFFTESLYYVDYLEKEKKSIEGDDSFGQVTVNNKYDTYVVVIGESVRRDFMHNYGFAINNTPFMSSVKGIFYNNYVSASGSTNLSLSRSLSMYPTMPNNIITLANKAGFSTYWISRQAQSGKDDGPVASIAKRAHETYFVDGTEKVTDKFLPVDGPVLPYFKKVLNAPSQKKLIVIHLLGSHSPFCSKVSNLYENDYKNKELSCYVQSIKNTDLLLSKIHDDLSKTDHSWSMIYFSDHGLSFVDNQQELIHGDKKKQNFEVPLFITSSDSMARETISAQRSGIHLFELFSEWFGIEEDSIKHTCKMLTNNDCENQNSVVNFEKNIVDFNKLPDDSIK